jgi:hypothetical protein
MKPSWRARSGKPALCSGPPIFHYLERKGVTMSEEILMNHRDQLVVAMAQGQSIRAWAERNGVSKSAAARWASKPEIRRQVNDWRRSCLDQVLGRMTLRSKQVVDMVFALAESADSETVRLQALRSLLKDQIAIARHSDLEFRVCELEDKDGIGDATVNAERLGPR